MNFDFYFTGISLDEEFEFLLDNNGCVLLSQLNQRKDILTWIDKIKSRIDIFNLLSCGKYGFQF